MSEVQVLRIITRVVSSLREKDCVCFDALTIMDQRPLSRTEKRLLSIFLSVISLFILNGMLASRSRSIVDDVIVHLKELNINLLAVDFDQTMIDIHTYGRWSGPASELLEHVRPQFHQLLNACMNNDIRVAIVTFSQQPKMITQILENVVGIENAARIPVRGSDRSWTYNGSGSRDGKQAYIASAVEELEQLGDVRISKQTTVLIDDDRKNIRIALKDGVRAVWFNPDKPHHLLKDLQRLV